jgi:YidC/Oxa1 family membrane protein insertase
MGIFNAFYSAIAHSIVWIHSALSHIFDPNSGWAWGLSIVLLVIAIRILLFPLFVKQIKTQRKMMEIQPMVKELQQKYRGDRETLNQELMKLYREQNANPLGGCLPLLVQMPIFLALFRVLNSFKPDARGNFESHYGIPASLVESAAKAKIFGAPISSSFRSSAHTLANLNATVGVVRAVTLAMIILMSASTFLTQRQLMARNASSASTPMAQQQKILLYILPLFFAVFGLNFPVGVLLYWLTTNIWSMGQQFLVLNRMHPAPGTGPAVGSAPAAPGKGPKPALSPGGKGAAKPLPRPAVANGPVAGTGGGGQQVRRQQPRKKSRKGRRGGRR